MPEDFLNKTFGELFNYLCVERHLIAIGLYRLSRALDNDHPYCYTNPPENVVLTHRDKVFVFSSDMPLDLCNNLNNIIINPFNSSLINHFLFYI